MFLRPRERSSQRIARAARFVLCIPFLALVACGGGGNNPPPPDTTAPSTPSGVTATPASSTQINLSWTASTDNVGVTGYQVHRCQGAGCSNFAQIGSPATTTFNDTGLTPSTSYSYRVRATDAAGNLSAFSSTATATTGASSGPLSVTIAPRRGGVATSQTLTFTATVTNDVGSQGVTWTKTGGTFANQTVTSVTFSSAAAGSFTITATSVADNTKAASATIGVTDLAGVFTWRYDNTRAGANQQEQALTPANVNGTTFGKLFSCAVDAPVYAEPLWMPNLSIGGGTHNVVFAATVHDTVYAFDADNTTCKTYWQKSLLGVNETFVSWTDVSSDDIFPDIGIVGTPVIDPGKSTLYVVSKSKATGSNCTPSSSCHQRLHALNLTDGLEKFGGPVGISASVTGTGDGSSAGSVAFDSLTQNQRPALTYLNGVVYLAWASHGDNGPYHGWVISYNATSLTQVGTYNSTPDGGLGGIWMSGNGLAVDAAGNLYCVTGNGTFDGTIPPTAGFDDFGDSVLKLSASGGVFLTDFFTPHDQSSLNALDIDLGSGGVVILPDQSTGGVTHLLFASSKSGTVYLLNRDNPGRFNASSDNVVQEFSAASGGGFFSTPAFWLNTMYASGTGDSITAWRFNHNTAGQFDAVPSSSSPSSYGFPGTSPVVSSSTGGTNGIVWAIDSSAFGTPCCANGPAVLHAYDATNLATELWNSSQAPADTAGNAVKFTVPTAANGKVYVGTRSEIMVYGLKP